MCARRSSIRASLLGGVIVLLAVTAGCGGGDGGDAASSTPTTAAGASTTLPHGGAQIGTLDVPASVACNGATSTSITIAYTTTDAASKQLLVDGLPIDGTDPPAGSLVVPVHCDELPHTVVMIAKDSDGKKTVKQTMVTTTL